MVLKVSVFSVVFQIFETALMTMVLADISFLLLNSRFQSLSSYVRSSYRKCFMKKGVLKNPEKSTGQHLFQSLAPATLLKKRL